MVGKNGGGRPPVVTERVLAIVAAQPGVTAKEIYAAVGCSSPEAVGAVLVRAVRTGRLIRQSAPKAPHAAKWLYYPAVAS